MDQVNRTMFCWESEKSGIQTLDLLSKWTRPSPSIFVCCKQIKNWTVGRPGMNAPRPSPICMLEAIKYWMKLLCMFFLKLTPRNVSNSIVCDFAAASITLLGEHFGCLRCYGDGVWQWYACLVGFKCTLLLHSWLYQSKRRPDAKQLKSINVLKQALCWLVALNCCQDSQLQLLKWSQMAFLCVTEPH